MICIYHSRDLDGFTSGAIVKRKYPDAILVGYDYGQDLSALTKVLNENNLAINEQDIIMIDVSLKMPEMFDLAGKCKSLTFIDHHKSAILEYEGVKDQAPANFTAVLQDGIAACEVGWKYLFPDREIPPGILLLGEYDTWRNGDKEKWEKRIVPFQYATRVICNSPETFPNYLFGDSAEIIDTLIENGKTIIKYQSMVNQMACKRAFLYEFEGLRAVCLNTSLFTSDVFKSVYDPDKHDIMMPFQFDGSQWVFSMYSTKPEIDVSVIAKKWGGGGHKGAAGFQLPRPELVFTFMAQTSSVELHLKKNDLGYTTLEMQGDNGDISQMLCHSMMGSTDLASIVCGAIPTFLDMTNRTRESYCKTVMEAVGAKGEKQGG